MDRRYGAFCAVDPPFYDLAGWPSGIARNLMHVRRRDRRLVAALGRVAGRRSRRRTAQDAVAQPVRLGDGQFAVEGEQLSPGGAVAGDGCGGAPRMVDGEFAGGVATPAGVLGAPDRRD